MCTAERNDVTTACYLIGERSYARTDPDFEAALALAYATRLRPRCLCRPGGIEMYVSRLANHYLLKRMPMSALQHAEHCAARSGVIAVEAKHDFRDPAIQEDDTGLVRVAVDASLDRRAVGMERVAAPHGASRAHGPPPVLHHKLSLVELLHYLWHEAGLDWWHPRFEGRRNWAVVRAHLLHPMQDKCIARRPMSQRVFIPEPFSVDRVAAIEQRRRLHWFGDLHAGHREASGGLVPHVRSRLILIAEVKEIAPAIGGAVGWQVVVRQMPNLPFMLTEQRWRSISKTRTHALALWTEGLAPHLLIAGVFDPHRESPPDLESAVIVAATEQWLLLEKQDDVARLSRLVRRGKAFSALADRQLSGNLPVR
jgi:hypothetical protein